MVEKRFRSLRIISAVLKVLAWIILVLGIIGAFIMFIAAISGVAARASYSYAPRAVAVGGFVGGLLAALLIVLAAVIYFLFLYAAGDAIGLALAIEENTRQTVHLLKGGDSLPRLG